MTTFPKILPALFFILFFSCKSKTVDTAPLIAKDTTNKNERNNTLFVFVGEKINVTPIPYKPGDFDSGIKAKYKILQRVYGNYDKGEIEFEAYDHFGRFPFSKYKNVLLFISEDKGKYYQEKYMYNDVYRTKDGRWAGAYDGDDYGHGYNKGTTVKPVRIDFVEEVSYPTKIKDEGKEITLTYPEPYFKTVGDKAIAVYGNYIEDLFKLKKDGYLTARELFGNKTQEELAGPEVVIQEIKDTTQKKKRNKR